MELFSVALTLFMIMNPLGNIQEMHSILKGIPHKRQNQILLRELLFALIAIVFFNYVVCVDIYGVNILKIFAPKMAAVHITAGVILFIVALRILFAKHTTEDIRVPGEPFLVPIAIPLVASPALLATVMLYSTATLDRHVTLLAAVIALVLSGICYFFSGFLSRTLKETGLLAVEKLMGMVLILIATQQVLHGIEHFFE